MPDCDPGSVSLATLLLGAGRTRDIAGVPAAPPTDSGSITRIAGERPAAFQPDAVDVVLLHKQIAAIEGAEDALILAGGAVLPCALLALLRPGDHLIASRLVGSAERSLFQHEFSRLGIDVTTVDPLASRAWRQALRKETRAVFAATPSDVAGRVLDLRPLSQLTRDAGLALIVDSTRASPINFRALDLGADVVVHAEATSLSGFDEVADGIVVGTAPYIDEVRHKMIERKATPDSFSCWLLERGLRTLDVRRQRQNDNAVALARVLANHPDVRRVHYAGLESHPDHELARDTMSGFGAALTVVLDDVAAATRFLSRLRIFAVSTRLGSVASLACEPRISPHNDLTPSQRSELGIPDGAVRLIAGIEAASDLIADVVQALER
ncbi:MAG: L-methionine gamma-lyase [Gemmatimonadaceae bacterium]|nr:L-methionine gamma-lyase [Gemmatimonadaceae bacterium]